jgi:branched-chain amino acid transport system ATP-binding protein
MNPGLKAHGHDSWPFWVMVINGATQGVFAGTLASSFIVIKRDLGMSDSALVAVSGLFVIAGALAGPFIGYVADRISRVAISAVAALAWALSALAFGVWPSIVGLVLMKIVHETLGGFGPLSTATTVPLLADYYPPEIRGRVVGAKAALAGTSVIPGGLLGAGISTVFGWQPAIIFTSFITLAGSLPWLTLREPARGRWDRLRLGVSEEVADKEQPHASFAESMRAAMAVRTLRRIAYAQIFLSAGGPVLAPIFLIITARNAGVAPIAIAIVAAIQQLAVGFGLSAGGTLVDRLLAHKPGRVMTFLGAVNVFNMTGILILALIHNRPIALFLLIAQPFVSATPIAARDTLLSLVVPARLRSFGLQLPSLFGLIGLLSLPIGVAVASGGDPITGSLLFATPLVGIGALIYFTASVDVSKDVLDARLAAITEEEMARSHDEGAGAMLITRQLDVHYDGVQILFGVDFDVREGELVALLGTNGAGKSTLLRAISGLAPITGGTAYLDGRDITHAPPHELARFGVVQMPGGKGVFPGLTVRENLQAAGWIDAADLDARIARVLDLFPALAERMDLAAGALSGGEQQMVALGQALIMRPKLLLIDELSLGLAPAVVEQLLRAVEAIHAQGTAVILVEQSVNLALTVADRAVFMEKGEIRFSGPTAELLARPDIVRSVYLKGTSGGSTVVNTRGRYIPAGEQAVVLEATDVHVHYGGVKALDGADVSVAAGEIVGLIGPNGAGKTTLFDAISGFVPLASGAIEISGRDATVLGPDQRARIGLGRSFQDAKLFPSLTVLEVVAVAMERHTAASRSAALSALWLPPVRRAERKLRARAEALIDLMGLGDYREKFVSELSTGSRRIVDLACEMAADPDVLLLDEPSSGIAQAEAEELGPLLDRVRRETGCGLLVIEHDMRLLTGIADRMVGMVRGQTIVSGTVRDVTEDDRMVEAYLGRSERVLARSGTPAPTETRST